MSAFANSPITFSRKKRFSLPWRERYEEIEASKVSGALNEGAKLKAKTQDSSVALPLRSEEDLLELNVFSGLGEPALLKNEKLATDLLKLQGEGTKFLSVIDGQKEEIGVYGAYNFFTGDLGVASYGISLTAPQSFGRVDFRGELSFQKFMKRMRFSEEVVATLPDNCPREAGRLLQKAAIADYEIDDPKQLKRLAASKMSGQTWVVSPTAPKILKSFYQDFEGVQDMEGILNELTQPEEPGKAPKLRFESARALYEVSLDTSLDDQAFSEGLFSAVKPDEIDFLGRAIAKDRFPEEFALATKLAGPLEQEYPGVDGFYFDAILMNPNVRDEAELALLAAQPIEGEKIDDELRFQLLNHGLKLSKQKRPRADFALALLEEKMPDGSPLIARIKDRATLLEAALDSQLPKHEFLLQSLSDLEGEEHQIVSAVMLGEYFPQRLKTIENLMSHSLSEQGEEQISALLSAAVESETEEDAIQMTLRAIETLEQGKNKNSRLVRALLRTGAHEKASRDAQAKKLVDLAMPRMVDGLRVTRRAETQSALFRAALQNGPLSSSSASEILNTCDEKEGSLILEDLGRIFFPERLREFNDLVEFSDLPPEERPNLKALLLASSLLIANVEDSEQLIKTASHVSGDPELFEATEILLRRSYLKRDSRKRARAKKALSLVLPDGRTLLRDNSSILNLYKQSMNTELSEIDYVVEVVANSHPDDQAYLLSVLGEPLLDELETSVPSDVFRELESGQLTASEFREIYDTLRGQHPDDSRDPNVEIEDDLVVIGNEELEVDL